MNLFVGNFDFEHHLRQARPPVLPAQVRELNDGMAFCLAALAEPGDCIWTPRLPEPDYAHYLADIGLSGVRFVSEQRDIPAGAMIVPWGWSRFVKDWSDERECCADCPDLDVVAEVNSREFSFSLEQEWEAALPGARAIRCLDDLSHALAGSKNGAWVLKAQFGMSGRERILGSGADLRPQDLPWVNRRLERGEPIFFEPWVEAIAEFGCQFSVPPAGSPTLEGITGLLTDRQGAYRGSRFGHSSENGPGPLPSIVLGVVYRAAQRIQERGYFGPLGIDVMNYRRADGSLGWRPLQDINARLTMGRVALGLRRLLQPGEQGDWIHLRTSEQAATQPALAAGARALRTSPLQVGDRPATRTMLLMISARTAAT